MPEQAERFVVVHTLVNDWPAGTVIDREALKTFDQKEPGKVLHDAHDRLLGLGAIRPAAEHEAGLARVPAPVGGMSTESQLRLGTLDAQIDQLTRVAAGLQDRLGFHQAAGNLPPGLPPAEDPSVTAAIAEREARVEHLARTVEALQGRLDQAQGKTAESDQARGQAAHEARGGREIATGQAAPWRLDQGEQAAGQAGQGAGGGATGARPAPPPPSPPQEAPPPPRRGRPPRSMEEGGGES